MNNNELADAFDRIASLMEIKGEVIYKTLAYRRAAESLRVLPTDAAAYWQEGRLTEIPGVGKAIADKISELLQTGELEFLNSLEQEVPPSLLEMLQVPDVGPKKVALFWKQAGVKTLTELETAARNGKLRNLPGMGEKSEARIIAGIEALSRRSKRMLLGNAWSIANRLLAELRNQKGVERAEVAGSLRRWKQTIGDLDLVAACSDPAPVMEWFTTHPESHRVLGKGESKSSIELNNGINVQLWVQPTERFGTLLQFVTGSKEHNVRLRELAQKKGLSLNEQAIVRDDGSEMLFPDEEGIYANLGLQFVPPELREDRGEVQLAVENKLPLLVKPGDIRSDLHMHTTWSDAAHSVKEMALAARALGYHTIAITDHTSGLGIAGGLTVEGLAEQRKDIDQAQQELGDTLRILQGAEVEIKADGELDYPDEVLEKMDIVVASLHTSLRQPRERITERLLNVIRNPHVDIIGHPSGRLLPNREGADLDYDQVLKEAQKAGIALEINAHFSRLDLDEKYVRRASEMGIMIAINSDAHTTDQLEQIIYGISVARRAWLNPDLVINTWDKDKLTTWLKNRGKR